MTPVTGTDEPAAVASAALTWWQCEPRRLARDQAEVRDRFPELTWEADGAGGWRGYLPRWPFHRLEPDGLGDLLGDRGLLVQVRYGHAYPMVPPALYPEDPEPGIGERTEHRWHVNGDGSLCLLKSDAAWTGRDSVVDLLLKAAGWRVEYALMRAGRVEAMTERGIVSDDSLDHLMRQSPPVAEPPGGGTGL